jgi:hypothetical protein
LPHCGRSAQSETDEDDEEQNHAENRSAGSVMRFQLAPYCNEQKFIFERWRNR